MRDLYPTKTVSCSSKNFKFGFTFYSPFSIVSIGPIMNTTFNQINIPPNGIGALPFTPLLAPSAVFASIFAIFFFLHLILAVVFRKYYGYAIGMVCGLLLEMLGYIAKVQLSHSRTNKNAYIMCDLPLPRSIISVC